MSLRVRPLWPRADPAQLKHWGLFADDLIRGLDSIRARNIPAVGHSLGGVVTLYAAVKRPDLFSRLILLDPTLLDPARLLRIRIARIFGWEYRKGLVEGALRRHRHWKTRREAFLYFKEKPLFKLWPRETVRSYAQSITCPSPGGGVELAYPPEWEARIYQTIPTNVWRSVRHLRVPTLVLWGEHSNVFSKNSQEAFRKNCPNAKIECLAGAGHLLAHERPEEVGKRINIFLKTSSLIS